MASIVTGERVTESGRVNEDQRKRSVLSEARISSARWVQAGVGAYEVQKTAADHVGVDKGYLNHQLAGRKPFNFTQAELMRRRYPIGFQRMVEAMAVDARMVVIPRAELELQAGEAETLRTTKAILGAMWPAFRDKLCASRWRCTGDLLEMALTLDAEMGK